MKSVDDIVAELRIKIAKNLARDVGIVSIDCDDALALSQMAADFAVMLAEGKRAIATLQREADGMREALRGISEHAENQDINHLDFRIHAKRCADQALEACSTTGGS